jgi:hypothetical protein
LGAAPALELVAVFVAVFVVALVAAFCVGVGATTAGVPFTERTVFLARATFVAGFGLDEISSKGFVAIVLRDRVTITIYLA